MKAKRKVIEIDEELCTGCGECIISCAEGALEIIDGKARLVADKFCDGLGACLGECPEGALKVVEREADEFDEVAVEHRLEELKHSEAPALQITACACPSAQVQSFGQPKPPTAAQAPTEQAPQASALGHWPVQIKLVPPTAPFLKNADLLVAADCTPVAYPTFHRDFLEGKVVMVGCPKFDDVQAYIEKFVGVFSHANIRSVTVVIMEVPCCGGLPMIVRRAMEIAGKSIPLEQVTISVRGEVLKKERLVA